MYRALVDQDFLFGRLDADIAVHRLIRELRLVGADDDSDIAEAQAGRRSHIHVASTIIGAGRHEFAVRQFFDDESFPVWRIARYARLAAEIERDRGADAGRM